MKTDTSATRVKNGDHPALDIARIGIILLSATWLKIGSKHRRRSDPRGWYDGPQG
ncbi:MAG: hypothetical protein VCD34_02710 [Planctomycetota bacterium]